MTKVYVVRDNLSGRLIKRRSGGFYERKHAAKERCEYYNRYYSRGPSGRTLSLLVSDVNWTEYNETA